MLDFRHENVEHTNSHLRYTFIHSDISKYSMFIQLKKAIKMSPGLKFHFKVNFHPKLIRTKLRTTVILQSEISNLEALSF